jgi:hypothetical protein
MSRPFSFVSRLSPCVFSLALALAASDGHASPIVWAFTGELDFSLGGSTTVVASITFDEANPNFTPGVLSRPLLANGAVIDFSMAIGSLTWDGSNASTGLRFFVSYPFLDSFTPTAQGGPPASLPGFRYETRITTALFEGRALRLSPGTNGALTGGVSYTVEVLGLPYTYTRQISSGTWTLVPEPASALLLGGGILLVGGARRWRRERLASSP